MLGDLDLKTVGLARPLVALLGVAMNHLALMFVRQKNAEIKENSRSALCSHR